MIELALAILAGLAILTIGLELVGELERSSEVNVAAKQVVELKTRIRDRYAYQFDHVGLAAEYEVFAPTGMQSAIVGQLRASGTFPVQVAEGNGGIGGAPATGYTITLQSPGDQCGLLAMELGREFDAVVIDQGGGPQVSKNMFANPPVPLAANLVSQACAGAADAALVFYAER